MSGFELSFQKWSAKIYWLISTASEYGGVWPPKILAKMVSKCKNLIYSLIVTLTTFTDGLKNVLNQLFFSNVCLLFHVKNIRNVPSSKTFNYSLVPNRRAGGIYLKSLCWMEFLPKCNSLWVEIRMTWLEKIWKINQCWGGTSIKHQRVHTYFHLLLWDDPLIFLNLSVWNYCDTM